MKVRHLRILLVITALVAASFGQEKLEKEPVVVRPIEVVPVGRIREPLEPIREPNSCDYLNGGLGTVDFDADGVKNCEDNCVFDRNKNQKDKDKNGVGDACEWRERADEEWDRIGQRQRRTASEPADLEKLARNSTNILLVRFIPEQDDLDEYGLGRHSQVEVIRQLKGKARRIPISVYRGIWVRIPDHGPRELYGDFEILVFLKNGKLHRWKRPHTWTNTPTGKPYTETHYFGYELTDIKYGVLGVSEARLKQLEEIVRRRR